MLVLTARLSLLASFLTLLIISSSSPITTFAAVIPVRNNSSLGAPTPDGTPSTQSPFHQDRPSDLGLPEGAVPDSAASRKGMSNGRSHSRSWSATGTRTGSWAKPTGAKSPPDSDSPSHDESGSGELPKRAHQEPPHARESVVVAGSRSPRRRFARGRSGKSSHKKRPLAVPAKKSRSIAIQNKQGSSYVVPSAKASSSGKKPYSTHRHRRFLMRRKEESGTPGVVNIMSHVDKAEPGKKIASLFLENKDKGAQFVLNASEKNSSTFYLAPAVPVDGGSHVAGSSRRRDESPQDGKASEKETWVNLRMQIDQSEYCATYDPNPPEAEPLTMQRCLDGDDGSKTRRDAGADADHSLHRSQTFSFDPESGVIRPMWYAGNDTDSSNAGPSVSSSASATPAASAAAVDPSASSTSLLASSSITVAAADASSPTTTVASASVSPTPSPTGTIAAREPSSRGVQNVSLVFVPSTNSNPSAAGVVGGAVSGGSESASPSATLGSNDEGSPLTMTTTVTVTSSATAAGGDETDSISSPTPSPSGAQNQADDESTMASPSMTTEAPAAAATDDDGATSTTTITISSSAAPAATSMATAGSLNVQVVGDDGKTVGDDDPNNAAGQANPSGSLNASGSAGATAATPTPSLASAADSSPSSTISASPSATAANIVDPVAIASGVAKSFSASQSASSAPGPTQTSSAGRESEADSKINGKREFRSRFTPISTAPYKWLFKTGP